jgi:membrane protein DedA with SNARE-associated domain
VTFSLVGSVVDLIVTVLTVGGLAGLFALMTVESFGIPPIPSEVILPFAGFLVATGVFALVPTIVVALAGALLGSYIAYAVGRLWRAHLTRLRVGPFGIEERDLARMDTWFTRHGEITVGVCRMLPVVRAYISYPAGTARMSPTKFGGYTLAGSIPFSLALLYAGMLLGRHWNVVEQYLGPLDDFTYAALVVLAIYVVLRYRQARRARRATGEAPPAEPAP